MSLAEDNLIKACEEFVAGWDHFLDCIDFGKSALDAEAICWWNTSIINLKKALKYSKEKQCRKPPKH